MIDTYAGTGETKPTPDGAPVAGTPLNGPRALARAPNGDLYLALREGNAVYRIDATGQTLHRVAGNRQKGYSGDGGRRSRRRSRGRRGLRMQRTAASTSPTPRTTPSGGWTCDAGSSRRCIGTGQPGDGPEPEPRRCLLSRPHGLLVTSSGGLLIADSEAHRIRLLQ